MIASAKDSALVRHLRTIHKGKHILGVFVVNLPEAGKMGLEWSQLPQ